MKASVIDIAKSKNFMHDEELKQRWLESDRKDIIRARLLQEARNRGRTQEEIAEVVGIKQRQVSYILTFADFLYWYEMQNSTVVLNANFTLHTVTERKFRGFLAKRKNELGKARHRAVLNDLIEHQKEQARHDNTRYNKLVKSLKETG